MREIIEYYDRRALEYDETITCACGENEVFEGASDESRRVRRALAALPPGRVLDVACGTGLFTSPLRGSVVALDLSAAMLSRAKSRLPHAKFVRADGTMLPFGDAAFDRVVTSHFYGHLPEQERKRFLHETWRVANELAVLDSALNDIVGAEEWQERVLRNGARYRVYKRHFTSEVLLGELGGGEVLFAGRWFVAVRSSVLRS